MAPEMTPQPIPELTPDDAAEGSAELIPISPNELVASSGSIRATSATGFEIHSPVLRAELGTEPRPAAEIAFVYRGPSQEEEPLTSGELRRQIGIKLRAQNTCNVVYVMWHIEPSTGLRVSVKSNPGQSLHSECGDAGYVFLEPAASKPVRLIGIGEHHVLRAAISDEELRVTADGIESWAGRLPDAAFGFDGPVGLRSDNGDFEVELRAPSGGEP